jgi:DtxR family Mn-dependent transcriptional regulator
MSDPLLTLIIGTAVLLLIVFIFYPDKGLLSIWKVYMSSSIKEQIEDALKHIYDCEYNRVLCNLNSIAGHLNISTNKCSKIIEDLQERGLIVLNQQNIELTTEGRYYALRIIRVHRLWETYLADQTSFNELEWHEEAEKREHTTTPEQADELAARTGNPLVDPHGDPIPSPDGKMPNPEGITIDEVEVGKYATITHLEDEPSDIYKQLIAMNLHIGQQVRLLESSAKSIRFEADGEIAVLAPLFAKNITVVQMPDSYKEIKTFRTLSDLKVGEEGEVIGISEMCRGKQRRRLLDLGVVPGTKITAELESVGGDPSGYYIRGALIAIRKSNAAQIYIN